MSQPNTKLPFPSAEYERHLQFKENQRRQQSMSPQAMQPQSMQQPPYMQPQGMQQQMPGQMPFHYGQQQGHTMNSAATAHPTMGQWMGVPHGYGQHQTFQQQPQYHAAGGQQQMVNMYQHMNHPPTPYAQQQTYGQAPLPGALPQQAPQYMGAPTMPSMAVQAPAAVAASPPAAPIPALAAQRRPALPRSGRRAGDVIITGTLPVENNAEAPTTKRKRATPSEPRAPRAQSARKEKPKTPFVPPNPTQQNLAAARVFIGLPEYRWIAETPSELPSERRPLAAGQSSSPAQSPEISSSTASSFQAKSSPVTTTIDLTSDDEQEPPRPKHKRRCVAPTYYLKQNPLDHKAKLREAELEEAEKTKNAEQVAAARKRHEEAKAAAEKAAEEAKAKKVAENAEKRARWRATALAKKKEEKEAKEREEREAEEEEARLEQEKEDKEVLEAAMAAELEALFANDDTPAEAQTPEDLLTVTEEEASEHSVQETHDVELWGEEDSAVLMAEIEASFTKGDVVEEDDSEEEEEEAETLPAAEVALEAPKQNIGDLMDGLLMDSATSSAGFFNADHEEYESEEE